jgi:hypothetical protein
MPNSYLTHTTSIHSKGRPKIIMKHITLIIILSSSSTPVNFTLSSDLPKGGRDLPNNSSKKGP